MLMAGSEKLYRYSGKSLVSTHKFGTARVAVKHGTCLILIKEGREYISTPYTRLKRKIYIRKASRKLWHSPAREGPRGKEIWKMPQTTARNPARPFSARWTNFLTRFTFAWNSASDVPAYEARSSFFLRHGWLMVTRPALFSRTCRSI